MSEYRLKLIAKKYRLIGKVDRLAAIESTIQSAINQANQDGKEENQGIIANLVDALNGVNRRKRPLNLHIATINKTLDGETK